MKSLLRRPEDAPRWFDYICIHLHVQYIEQVVLVFAYRWCTTYIYTCMLHVYVVQFTKSLFLIVFVSMFVLMQIYIHVGSYLVHYVCILLTV